jgi:hypothetical protein
MSLSHVPCTLAYWHIPVFSSGPHGVERGLAVGVLGWVTFVTMVATAAGLIIANVTTFRPICALHRLERLNRQEHRQASRVSNGVGSGPISFSRGASFHPHAACVTVDGFEGPPDRFEEAEANLMITIGGNAFSMSMKRRRAASLRSLRVSQCQ